ncbi:MAG: hypothetical protein KGH67_02920, partial [Candidatus Micrarchaeota archaeon]|nr:hypothetical protein [Candidatus Micrarchaeota archaeon]
MAEFDNTIDYTAYQVGDRISFSDKSGRQIAIVKPALKPNIYEIDNPSGQNMGYMTGWADPAVAISGIPISASSTIIKLYDKENGPQVGSMAVTPQSILSTQIVISLLDFRDRILAIIAETAQKASGKYAIKDQKGQQFAEVSRINNNYLIKIGTPNIVPDIFMVKLVTALM